jgi:hypothetical protein
MEPLYIKSGDNELKSKIMAEQLENSPEDKYKAFYGEHHQATYLINAK